MKVWQQCTLTLLCMVGLALGVNICSQLRNIPWGMVVCFRSCECVWQNSCVNCLEYVWLHCLCSPHMTSCMLWWLTHGQFPDISVMIKWCYSTRLETRTKESSIDARPWVCTPDCTMKITAGMCALATDQLIERGLSMSMYVRTRKMVNYA